MEASGYSCYTQPGVVEDGSLCSRKFVRITRSNPKRGQEALGRRVLDKFVIVELRGLSCRARDWEKFLGRVCCTIPNPQLLSGARRGTHWASVEERVGFLALLFEVEVVEESFIRL
jgi:hypothetical protein